MVILFFKYIFGCEFYSRRPWETIDIIWKPIGGVKNVRREENYENGDFLRLKIWVILVAQKKLFWKRHGESFSLEKMGGGHFKILSLAQVWCKNIRGIDWYYFQDHTTSQSTYKAGKWRKVRFCKNDAPIISLVRALKGP